MKKTIIRILVISALSIVSLLGLIYLIAWKSPDYYVVSVQPAGKDSIIHFSNYDSVSDHERPFVLHRENVLVFGAEHTRDAKDAQIMMIENAWDTFRPTVALVEGRMGFLLPFVMNPVETLGENGKVKELAHRDGIKVYNWDLSKEELARNLLQRYSAEQIALGQILNPYFSSLRFGKPSSPEDFASGYIKRAAYVNLEDSIKTVEDIDSLWNKYFPHGKNWRETSDEYRLPGYLGEMMEYTNDLRNYQLVAAVRDLSQKGERVFVICGSSHAACIEPAFRQRKP